LLKIAVYDRFFMEITTMTKPYQDPYSLPRSAMSRRFAGPEDEKRPEIPVTGGRDDEIAMLKRELAATSRKFLASEKIIADRDKQIAELTHRLSETAVSPVSVSPVSVSNETASLRPWLAYNLPKATYYRRKAAGSLPPIAV
jgi:hypothetical protein